MQPMAYEDNHQPYEKIVLLRCDVYDTGIGIPEKSLPSLFKKYMQVSADHARKYGGTGLGLAICKQLVELMGGHLTVTSQVNRGSTFTFLLPCKVATKLEFSDDSDGDPVVLHCESSNASSSDQLDGSFLFQPRSLSSGFPSGESFAQGSNLSNSLSASSANRELDEVSESYLRGSKPRKKAVPEVVSLKSCVSKKLNSNDVYQGIIHDNIDKTEISGRKEKELKLILVVADWMIIKKFLKMLLVPNVQLENTF
ncbi:hypothetical protein HPP92_026133 [Vanilla planifolia]|uniref:histidine kinase n=1 Tax=Vanilla planifolia TaxID=51239 RepID=A0A835PE60_VANPL|nr:hypothetical protein HPP92_026133 [Vanilla planifolia]